MTMQTKLAKYAKVYSAATISRAAGLSAGSLSAILNSERPNPKVETVRALARALGVDPLWLIDENAGWPPVVAGRPTIEELAEVA